MSKRPLDLMLVLLIAGGAVALALTPGDSGLLRVALTLPLVLVLPGYALVAALLPWQALELAERLLLSVGTSLALTIGGGLLLNLQPWGLRTGSWALLLGGITVGAALVALRRRRSLPATAPGARPAPGLLGWRQGAMLLLSLGLVGMAFAIARTPAPPQGLLGYSMLWMLPEGSEGREVQLGIRSQEFTTVRYRLAVSAGGAQLGAWEPVELDPGEDWDATLALPQGLDRGTDIVARLYRLDAPDRVYRWALVRGQAQDDLGAAPADTEVRPPARSGR